MLMEQNLSFLKVLGKNSKTRKQNFLKEVQQYYKEQRESRVKLTNAQLSKLKSAAKRKTGAILRINMKNLEDEDFLHELFVITRQTTKIRNAFANNMSTDIKLSKTQIPKLIQ